MNGEKKMARPMGKRMSGYAVPLFILVLLAIVLTLVTSSFLTYENIFNLARSTAVYGIVAIAMTFVIITGGIDLSVGPNVGLAGMIVALLVIQGGVNMWVAMIIGVAACALVGFFNGAMVYDGKLPPFIATLGTLTIIRAVIMLISGARNITGFDTSFLQIAKTTWGVTAADSNGVATTYGIPLMAFVWIVVILVAYFIVKKTIFGRSIFAIGSNMEAARLSGISVRKTTYGAYIFSGILCGIGGILLTSRLASGIPTLGQGYELDAIASAVVGGASMSGGEGSVGGTVVGAILIATIRNGGVLLGWNGQIIEIVIGCLIVFAVLLDSVSKRRAR
jgi:ribose/xylose/arabinose/galactoside ABC-type transport system permease subunit